MSIRIAHVVTTLGVGGQEMVIRDLVAGVDRTRFESMVVALHEGGPMVERIRELGVTVEVIGEGAYTGLELTRELARRLRRFQPDVLHTHNPAPHQHGALAKLMAGIPVLVHTKHGRNNITRRSRRMAERIAGLMTDVVVPVSADAAEVAHQTDWVPRRKIRVIRNGVAIQAYTVPGEPLTARPPRAVHVARLHRIKDQETLLRAAQQVAAELPEFRLDMVGDGPDGRRLRDLAARFGIGDVVRFHGMQDNVRPYLHGARFFVLSSLSEGIALTALEAMSCGLPVIATDVGGNREVVEPGVTGALVPVGDVSALASAMVDLLRDPARAARYGEAGRERACREFDLARTIAAYEELYLDLLRRNAPERRLAA